MDITQTTVAIIGSGFAGLAMAVRLKEAGLTDVLILERAQQVGGTWRDNIYPGAACDIPSHLYSFSFDLNPQWPRTYSRQPDIQAYLCASATRHGLDSLLRFGADVRHAHFDAERALWTLTCADGRVFEARFVVHGVGGLRDPRWPDLPGIDSFKGVSMHSAQWDPTADLRGKRVGVIGTGASAIQIVPELAGAASALHVFQRTPPWIIPRDDRAFSARTKALFSRLPAAMSLYRLWIYLDHELRFPLAFGRVGWTGRLFESWMRAYIKAQIADPELARALTPTYHAGCKRILISSDWYPALNRDDVHVEQRAIQAVCPEGLRLEGGQTVALDALIYCTGFKVDRPLGQLRVTGLDGLDLGEFWGERPRAWLGMAVPGFPNSYMLMGPNTALGHNSVVVMIEAQVRYVAQAIAHTLGLGAGWLDARSDALDAFLHEIDSSHASQVWLSGCRSWYLNADGENFTIWPGTSLSYLWRTRAFDPASYTTGGGAAPAPRGMDPSTR